MSTNCDNKKHWNGWKGSIFGILDQQTRKKSSFVLSHMHNNILRKQDLSRISASVNQPLIPWTLHRFHLAFMYDYAPGAHCLHHTPLSAAVKRVRAARSASEWIMPKLHGSNWFPARRSGDHCPCECHMLACLAPALAEGGRERTPLSLVRWPQTKKREPTDRLFTINDS